MEVFLTPQNLGGGIFSRVVAAGRSNLHVTDTLFGPRLKHLCFFLLTAHHIYISTTQRWTFAQTFTLQLAHLLFVAMISSACSQYAILRGFCRGSRSGNAIVALLHLPGISHHVVCRVRCQKLGKALGRQ